jgi:tRNA threonylcarbamoyladenosine biosynthesis protein TsaE
MPLSDPRGYLNRGEPRITRSPAETRSIAERLVGCCVRGTVIALHGDLGSGKTCFVQGIAEALGIDLPVTSPTFTLVNEYRGRMPLYHVDLYRLTEVESLFSFGLEDYCDPDGITAIEWAERAGDLLPASSVHVDIKLMPEPNTRSITVDWPPEQTAAGNGGAESKSVSEN